MRLSKTRNKIIDLLTDFSAPVSASDILKKINVNKTTVYRELDHLISNEIINEVDFLDGKKRYELKDLPHHHHLVCLNCKSVDDIDVDEQFITPSTFKVIKHNLEFFGLCANCQ